MGGKLLDSGLDFAKWIVHETLQLCSVKYNTQKYIFLSYW